MASVVLPTPAVPVISAIGEACGTPPCSGGGPGSSACSRPSSAVRPAKPAGSGGSCAGHGAGSADGPAAEGPAAEGPAADRTAEDGTTGDRTAGDRTAEDAAEGAADGGG